MVELADIVIEPVRSGDADEFLSIATVVLNARIREVQPTRLVIVKVDNWFGPRWLEFSHKELGAFGVHSSELRIPPFAPGRIVAERHYVRGAGGFELAPSSPSLHIHQSSSENRNRYFRTIGPRGLALWWSGKSENNARGALMCYQCVDEDVTGWHAQYQCAVRWRLAAATGIDPRELKELVER